MHQGPVCAFEGLVLALWVQASSPRTNTSLGTFFPWRELWYASWWVANGRLLVVTRRLDVLARVSLGMSGRPLEEQTGAQGKRRVTFVLLVWAVIARGDPTFQC